MGMHKILITHATTSPFTQKFPGGSPNEAIQSAAVVYPNARHIEWKGECQTDEQEAASAAFFAECERKTQETYARQAEQTAKNWEHQRQLDARDASAPSCTAARSSSSGGGGGLFALLVVAGIGFIGVTMVLLVSLLSLERIR